MISLVIETSTERGVVALFKENVLIYEGKLPFGLQNSKSLFPEIVKAFTALALNPTDLNWIAVGVGPGSYTGIRVGAMTAKTFGFALNIPLIGICSLSCFVPKFDGSFASIIDAKIGGVYLQKGTVDQGIVNWLSEPALYSLENAVEMLRDTKTLISPSITLLKAKFENLAKNSIWSWIESDPTPSEMAIIARNKYKKGEFSSDQQLDLLYLRKTQAEIESKTSSKSSS